MKKKNLTIWENHLDLNFMKKHNSKHCGEGEYKHYIASEIVSHNYKSVLDVGAGVGVMSEVFTNMDNKIKYTAVEITEKYVEYMKSKNIDCLHCVDSIPLKDNSYDCVISFETINHQEDYKPHLNELLRIAKNKVYVSFFKKFQEDVKVGSRDLTGKWNIYENECGLIEERNQIDGETVCIYNFINKKKLTEYLDSLNLDYEFCKGEKKSESIQILSISIEGKNKNEKI